MKLIIIVLISICGFFAQAQDAETRINELFAATEDCRKSQNHLIAIDNLLRYLIMEQTGGNVSDMVNHLNEGVYCMTDSSPEFYSCAPEIRFHMLGTIYSIAAATKSDSDKALAEQKRLESREELKVCVDNIFSK